MTHCIRSIPAWAGEPAVLTGISSNQGLSPRGRGNRGRGRHHHGHRRVYPRVGGGTCSNQSIVAHPKGLSPRGRGNHRLLRFHDRPSGSIPAWAGEPQPSHQREPPHGRSIPAWAGEPRRGIARIDKRHGLSPRGRGNQSCRRGLRPPNSTVYPRVGGGTPAKRGFATG